MNKAKDKVAEILGGKLALAEACGVTSGAVSQWDTIPSKHLPKIIEAAKKLGKNIKITDLVDDEHKSVVQ